MLTRDCCHLCHEMAVVLDAELPRYGLTWTAVAIDDHPKWVERFNDVVPVLLRDGKPVGNVRSASYGHTLGASVGLAMVSAGDGGSVDAAYLREGKWEVDIAGRIYAAEVSLRPFYDPDMARIKA